MNATDFILTEFIKQRMLHLGYCRDQYQLTTHALKLDSPTRISAFNEYWYLISHTVPGTCSIESDSDFFSVDTANNYKGFQLYGNQEFTGNILINYTGPETYFEFIRAIVINKKS